MGWEQSLKPIAFGLFYYVVKRLVKYLTSRYWGNPKPEEASVGSQVGKAGVKAVESANKGAVQADKSTGSASKESRAKIKKAERRAEQKTLAEKREREASTLANRRKRRNSDSKKALLIMALCLGVTSSVCAYCYRRYGPLFFVGAHKKRLSLSSIEWQHLLKNRSVCFVGGHHRAGTTVVWRSIAMHPKVAWFGEQRDSGLDFSEGVFAQDVYPRFGIGLELNMQTVLGGNKGGVGKYALQMEPSELVWTEDRATSDVQARLLNSFGFHWDRRPPGLAGAAVWLEKSPPNVVLARFLQAVVDLEDLNPRRATPAELELEKADFFDSPILKPTDSRARFVFVTRHPIPVALSSYDFGAKLRTAELVAHWLAIETYAKANSARLAKVQRVKLEEFAKDPVEMLLALWRFLDLHLDRQLALNATRNVRPDPNKHHRDRYCASIANNHNAAIEHDRIVATFDGDIRAFGYEIATFCTESTAGGTSSNELEIDPPSQVSHAQADNAVDVEGEL